ncbi:MAG: K(+)-transporting ATPase subunit F [Proteobacteria bacterium]|nr:K(+)-transporting ATPase subunit F [Pseudomonadota bacterium]
MALRCSAPTPFFATIYRARRMSDPVIGLVVAVVLAIYLLYTLAHPEKF